MSIYTVRQFPASLHLAHILTWFFAQFFFSPIREHLNYATFRSEEKHNFSQRKVRLVEIPLLPLELWTHVWSLLTYFYSWWLTSELILKDSRRQKIPTSIAATEIWTKSFLSLTTHMISCLSYNLHNSTAAGYITHIICSWKYDKITVVQLWEHHSFCHRMENTFRASVAYEQETNP